MQGPLAKEFIAELLQEADIAINGASPWDIQIHNENFYSRVLNEGALGLGESYMDGWWDVAQLDAFFYRIFRANLESKIKKNKRLLFRLFLAKIINLQTKLRSLDVGKKHYDLGNLLFEKMLDSRLNYTCGYWKDAQTLEEAQFAKLDLVCQKLKLEPGMRLLDIGCGWGALAKHAAVNYGVSVVGITISQQQLEYAKQCCAGLPVDIRFQDYRDLNETFDRISSLGMFEHVGHLNYETYFDIINRCLVDDTSLFLLHTIGSNITYYKTNEWICKYIFPNGVLPSIKQIGAAAENRLALEDWHSFGESYDKTLMAWQHNFVANWPELKNHYDERFYRMWNFYLLSSAGGFRARDMQLWQIVFSKKGLINGYQSVR